MTVISHVKYLQDLRAAVIKISSFFILFEKMKKVSDISVSWCISKPYFVLLYACDLSYFDVVFTGVGTGPADPAAGGPII